MGGTGEVQKNPKKRDVVELQGEKHRFTRGSRGKKTACELPAKQKGEKEGNEGKSRGAKLVTAGRGVKKGGGRRVLQSFQRPAANSEGEGSLKKKKMAA